MINEQYKRMLEGKSVIRQLSEFATERGKEIGYETCLTTALEILPYPFRGSLRKQ